MVAGGLEAMLLPDPVQPRRVERLARLDVQSAHQITHGAAHPGEALVEFDATDHDVLRLLVRAQVHGMAEDPEFAGGGDLGAARELVGVVGPGAGLFTYPGDRHLFTVAALASYDAEAADQVLQRVLGFLDRL